MISKHVRLKLSYTCVILTLQDFFPLHNAISVVIRKVNENQVKYQRLYT